MLNYQGTIVTIYYIDLSTVEPKESRVQSMLHFEKMAVFGRCPISQNLNLVSQRRKMSIPRRQACHRRPRWSFCSITLRRYLPLKHCQEEEEEGGEAVNVTERPRHLRTSRLRIGPYLAQKSSTVVTSATLVVTGALLVVTRS